MSDLLSDDESIFFNEADDNIPSEANGDASSSGIVLNGSANDEMNSKGCQTRLDSMKQIDAPNSADDQAFRLNHEFVFASIQESTFESNTEKDQIMSISNGETNGQEQQNQAVLGQSVAPNPIFHQPKKTIQDEEMHTSPAIAPSTEGDHIILISDDEEEFELFEISDDSDDEANNNTADAMRRKGHVRKFKVLFLVYLFNSMINFIAIRLFSVYFSFSVKTLHHLWKYKMKMIAYVLVLLFSKHCVLK